MQFGTEQFETWEQGTVEICALGWLGEGGGGFLCVPVQEIFHFLGALAKLLKATVSYTSSSFLLCVSAWKFSAPNCQIFVKFCLGGGGTSVEICRENQLLLKSTKKS